MAPIRQAVARHPAIWIAGLVWLVASLYWEFEARSSAANRKAEARAARGLHVLLINTGLLLLFVPVPGFTARYLPPWPLIAAAGLAIETGGFLLAIRARRHLGRNWSGRITIKVEHRLIRSGPYRFVRHPIYTAFLAMYGGTAIVSGEWHALAGFAPAVLAYWRKIRMEEQNLVSHFGDEWSDYCRATSSLLPRAVRHASI